MAWSVPIWKNYGFHKVSLYLVSFVLKHATAHIQTRCVQLTEYLIKIKSIKNSQFAFSTV